MEIVHWYEEEVAKIFFGGIKKSRAGVLESREKHIFIRKKKNISGFSSKIKKKGYLRE